MQRPPFTQAAVNCGSNKQSRRCFFVIYCVQNVNRRRIEVVWETPKTGGQHTSPGETSLNSLLSQQQKGEPELRPCKFRLREGATTGTPKVEQHTVTRILSLGQNSQCPRTASDLPASTRHSSVNSSDQILSSKSNYE